MARDFAVASSQYLSASSSVVAWYDGVTVMCRVRPTSAAPAATRVAFGFGYSASTTPLLMIGQLATTGLGFLQIRDNATGDTGVMSGGSALAANTWTTIGCGSNGANDHELYVAGASVATSTTALGATSSDRTAIGCLLRSTAAVYWDGGEAEVAVWTSKLADSAHAEYAKGWAPTKISPLTLAAYWPLYGRASPEYDHVGAFSMTLSGTPTQSAHPRMIGTGRRKLRFVPAAAVGGTGGRVVPLRMRNPMLGQVA